MFADPAILGAMDRTQQRRAKRVGGRPRAKPVRNNSQNCRAGPQRQETRSEKALHGPTGFELVNFDDVDEVAVRVDAELL
jgi:hypothetical protein